MKTFKAPKLPALRSAVLCALTTRRGGKMKHRNAPRGGSKNIQAAYHAGNY